MARPPEGASLAAVRPICTLSARSRNLAEEFAEGFAQRRPIEVLCAGDGEARRRQRIGVVGRPRRRIAPVGVVADHRRKSNFLCLAGTRTEKQCRDGDQTKEQSARKSECKLDLLRGPERAKSYLTKAFVNLHRVSADGQFYDGCSAIVCHAIICPARFPLQWFRGRLLVGYTIRLTIEGISTDIAGLPRFNGQTR